MKTRPSHALLHDAVEDQGGQATAERNPPPLWRSRHRDRARLHRLRHDAETPLARCKERYIAHVDSASPSILLVSAADKLHNARSILSRLSPARRSGMDSLQWWPRRNAVVLSHARRQVQPLLNGAAPCQRSGRRTRTNRAGVGTACEPRSGSASHHYPSRQLDRLSLLWHRYIPAANSPQLVGQCVRTH